MTSKRAVPAGKSSDALAALWTWLAQSGFAGREALVQGQWRQWNTRRTEQAQALQRAWQGWIGSLNDAPLTERLHTALLLQLERAQLHHQAVLAAEVPWWPVLPVVPGVTLHATAVGTCDPGGPWSLQSIAQENGYDQVLVHLVLAPKPVASAGRKLEVEVHAALGQLAVVWPADRSWPRKLAQWLQTPPTPVWLLPQVKTHARDAVLLAFAQVGQQVAPAVREQLFAGQQLWLDWLDALASGDRQMLATQQVAWARPEALEPAWWLDPRLLDHTTRQAWADLLPDDAALGVVRAERLPTELRERVQAQARATGLAPAAVVVRGDATRVLPAVGPALAAQGLQMPALRGVYWDPPYNTGSRAFAYRDRRDHAVWQGQLRQTVQQLTPLLASDAWLATSMGQEGEPALRDAIASAHAGWQRLATVQVLVRHPERVLVADRALHEVTEALSLWQRDAAAQLWRTPAVPSLDEHVWQLAVVGPAAKIIRVGERDVGLWPPEQMVLQRVPPNPQALKRVLIRGALREANSSGRLYVAALEPLREAHPGWYAFVPDLGSDGQPGRWFSLPAHARLRNGAYFQGVASKPRPAVVTDCWDLIAAYNQVDREGGVRYRHGKKPLALLDRVLTLQGAQQHLAGWWLDPMAGSGSLAEALWRLRQLTGGQQTALLIERGAAADEVLAPRLLHMLQGAKQPFAVLWLRSLAER